MRDWRSSCDRRGLDSGRRPNRCGSGGGHGLRFRRDDSCHVNHDHPGRIAGATLLIREEESEPDYVEQELGDDHAIKPALGNIPPIRFPVNLH